MLLWLIQMQMGEASGSVVALDLEEAVDGEENVHEAQDSGAEEGAVEVTVLDVEEDAEEEPVSDASPSTHDGMSMTSLLKMEVIPCYSMASVISATYFTSMLVSTLEVVYVGHLGDTELAAVALAVMFSNVTGYSIAIGTPVALCL